MSQQQHIGGNERFVRRYDYGDRVVLAADLNVADDEVDVDVVGSTAIVVVDADDRVTETEFELPGSDATVTTRNGVLTITVETPSDGAVPDRGVA
jgi:HSP20 family molecular chaperone IbpA